MHTVTRALLATLLCSSFSFAHAAWGDASYDPDPPLFDLDQDAQFDTFGALAHIVTGSNGATQAIQNFESGFAAGQQVDSWVALGDTRMRFGFGNTIDSVQWRGVVGGIDPASQSYGLDHPHGTYGNAPGIVDQPRNYVADIHYLTYDPTTMSGAPGYFVMQFEQPVSAIGFTMIDYANGNGGSYDLTLWNGAGLDDLVSLDTASYSPVERSLAAGEPDGNITYVFGAGRSSSQPPHLRPTFNFAILHLGTPDATVGFDNFVAGIMPVPEPETYSLMLLGLAVVGAFSRRTRKAS